MTMPAFGRWPKMGLPGPKTCSRMLQLVRNGDMTLVDVKKKHAHMGKWIAEKIEKKHVVIELLSTSKALQYHQLRIKALQFHLGVLKKKNGKLQKNNDKLQQKVVAKVRIDKNNKLQKKVAAKVGIDKNKKLQKNVAAKRHSGYWPNISLWPPDGLPGKSTMSLLVINAKRNKDLMPYLEEKVPIVHAYVKDLLEKNEAKEPGKSKCYVLLKQYRQGLITMEQLQKKNAAIAKFVQEKTDFLQGRQYERYVRDMQPESNVADNAMESQEDREFYASLSALDTYAYP